jgi:hypothetical protein
MKIGGYKLKKHKILYYRAASDEEILFVLNDKPYCGYALIHQAACKPFAKREAKKRKLIAEPF